MTIRDRRGYARKEKQKMPERNEALDVRIYNRAVASIIGLDRFKERDWAKYESNMGVAKPIEKVNNKADTKKERQPKRRRRKSGSFW